MNSGLKSKDYEPDYTDGAGSLHALCTGRDKCCDGDVWGDVIPGGKYRGGCTDRVLVTVVRTTLRCTAPFAATTYGRAVVWLHTLYEQADVHKRTHLDSTPSLPDA